MNKSIYFLLFAVLGILFSCLDDDTDQQQNETSTETKKIITKRTPFEETLHYGKLKTVINQMTQSLNVQNKDGKETETFDILTDEVVYMGYEDSHTYTFKVRRSNPQFYIENIVLHYNPETGEYDEFLMQYLVNEQEYLNIVNDDFIAEDIPVIARKFENGTFSGIVSKMNCSTNCNVIKIRCTSGEHGPGDSGCTLPPGEQAYTYISCTTNCYVNVGLEDPSSPGNGYGGGGGGTYTIPFPMEPCNSGNGNGSSTPGTGIDDGNGMCVVPWVAVINAQLKLTQAELRVLRDYPELVDLFGYYFDEMGNNADYGLIRSLINYMVVNNNYQGVEFVEWVVYYAIDNSNVNWEYIQNLFFSVTQGNDGGALFNINDYSNQQSQQVSLPSHSNFYNNFPKVGTNEMTTSNVYALIGGHPWIAHSNGNQNYQNACALRLSRALNYSGINIPVWKNNQNVQKSEKGNDNKNYILDASSMLAFMLKTFSNSQPIHLSNKTGVEFFEAIKDKKGIYIMVPKNRATFGASGHCDYFDGKKCYSGCYFDSAKEIYFWELN